MKNILKYESKSCKKYVYKKIITGKSKQKNEVYVKLEEYKQRGLRNLRYKCGLHI